LLAKKNHLPRAQLKPVFSTSAHLPEVHAMKKQQTRAENERMSAAEARKRLRENYMELRALAESAHFPYLSPKMRDKITAVLARRSD